MKFGIVYGKLSLFTIALGFALFLVLIPIGLKESEPTVDIIVFLFVFFAILLNVLALSIFRYFTSHSPADMSRQFFNAKIRTGILNSRVKQLLSVGVGLAFFTFGAYNLHTLFTGQMRGNMSHEAVMVFSAGFIMIGFGLANFSIAVLLFPGVFRDIED